MIFTLYGPGDATCSNALWSTTVPVGAGGVSHSGDVEVGAAGTCNWVATYSGDLNNLPVSSECGSEPVVITPQTLLGRAYGLSANVSLLGLPLINRPPTPDTGEIATTLDSSTSVPCVATLSGPLSAHALCASVTTTAFPAGSTAVASVADVSLSVATLPTITIGAVHSTSTTSCDGSTGATTIEPRRGLGQERHRQLPLTEPTSRPPGTRALLEEVATCPQHSEGPKGRKVSRSSPVGD